MKSGKRRNDTKGLFSGEHASVCDLGGRSLMPMLVVGLVLVERRRS
jgi:hypothetical protein